MAANLVKAGHQVLGFDTAQASCSAARDHGVTIAESAGLAALDVDAVVTMLPSGPIVRAAYEASGGILQNASRGTLFVECPTIDVESARCAHALAEPAGLESVDAPVSGGVGVAVAGS